MKPRKLKQDLQKLKSDIEKHSPSCAESYRDFQKSWESYSKQVLFPSKNKSSNTFASDK